MKVLEIGDFNRFEDMFVNDEFIIGDGVTDNSWKIVRSSSPDPENYYLEFYRLELGSWVKQSFMGGSVVSDSFVLDSTDGNISFTRNDGSLQIMLKPSIDGFGSVLGNPDGRVAFVSKGEHTLAYPTTENALWVEDRGTDGGYSPMATEFLDTETIVADEIMYKIKINASTAADKFRVALLNATDDSILLQNVTKSEYDLGVNIDPLLIGENTIDLKYPIAFTKGLNIKVLIETPTNTSFQTELGKISHSIYRKYAELGTMDYSSKWREGYQFYEDNVIQIEAIDVNYDLTKIGTYIALSDHIASSSFDTDLTNLKWKKQEYFPKDVSTGITGTMPTLTDIGGGIVDISSSVAKLFRTNDYTGKLLEYTIPELTGISLTDNETNYIIVNYNSGNPVYQNTTDVSIINESDIIPVYTIYRQGNDLHELCWNSLADGMANKLHARFVKTRRFEREENDGLLLSEYGTRNIRITEGHIWQGATKIIIPLFESATTQIELWHHTTGVWTKTLTNTYTNDQYDDGTDLQTLGNNRYVVNWVYSGVDINAPHSFVVLSDELKNISEAEAATIPSDLPDIITKHSILVGRIIVKKSGTSATSIQSAFDVKFISSGILSDRIEDADGDTGIYVEQNEDEDKIRMVTAGQERVLISETGDFTFNDDTNSRIFVDATESYIMSPDGTLKLSVDNTNGFGRVKQYNVYSNTLAASADVHINADGYLYRATSSIKIKKDIDYAGVDPNLALQLKPVSFVGKSDNKSYLGFIAEDCRDIDSRLASDGGEDDLPGLEINAIISSLTALVQEQQKQIDTLKNEIEKLKNN